MLAATLFGTVLLTQQAPQNPKKVETKEEKAERIHQEDLKRDAEAGVKYAAEVDKEMKASSNQEYIARVQKVGAVIAEIANKTPIQVLWGDKRLNTFNYTFKVVQGDDVNAFSLPGGYIYVYEGLLKQIESDDELAGVLAHEVAHASERHVSTLQKEQAKLQNISLPLVLLAILTGGASAAGNVMGLGSLVMQATGSGWSVKAEEAADYGGFQYLLKSPYDPTGMLTFMEKLARRNQLTDHIDWGIYKSHPPSHERADTLTAYMKKANIPIRRSRVAASFRTTVQEAIGGGVQLRYGGKTLVTFGGPDAKARASAAAERVNTFFDTQPELFELKKGDNGQILGGGKVLFQMTPVDSLPETVDQGQTQAIKALQLAMYSIGSRVWDR
jgi:predicted Zn-dependent protease